MQFMIASTCLLRSASSLSLTSMHEPTSPHVYSQSETPPTRLASLLPINWPGPRSLLHAYLSAHGSEVPASASFPSSCFPAAVFLFRGGTRDTERKDSEGSPRLHSHRLRGVVRGEVQVVIEAEPMQEGVRDVLCAVQLRAAGDVRELRKLPLLWTDDHPRWPTQVPLIVSVLFAKKKLSVMERAVYMQLSSVI